MEFLFAVQKYKFEIIRRNLNTKTTFPRKKIMFWYFFLCSFRIKTSKTFYVLELETLFYKKKLKIGKNNPEIANLEFENHGFLKNKVFLQTEQAGTNIC